jgi:LysM repeat protein
VPTPTPVSTTLKSFPLEFCASNYTIQPGDDCHSISKSQNVSTSDLLWPNELNDCSNLPGPGRQLCIVKRCQVYTVQPGDTCSGIAGKHNMEFAAIELKSWNPLINKLCTNLNMLEGYEICVRSALRNPSSGRAMLTSTDPFSPPDSSRNGEPPSFAGFSTQAHDRCEKLQISPINAFPRFMSLNHKHMLTLNLKASSTTHRFGLVIHVHRLPN